MAALCLAAATGCSGGGGGSPASPVAPSAAPAPSVTSVPAIVAAPTLTDGSDWPTFGHDLSRTSTQPGSSALSASNVGQMQLLWYYKSAAVYDLSSPVELGGIVYAADIAGNLTALDETTGATVWQRSLGAAVKQTPAIYDGRLFVGTFVNSPNQRSVLYALDPATGATEWQTSVPGGFHGSPVAMDGELYEPVTLGDTGFCNPGGIYEFDESTGASGLKWLVGGSTKANGGAVWAPITYDGTRLLYGTGNTCITSPESANAVVALSPAAMQPLWVDQTANPLTDDDVGGGVIESGEYAYVTGKNGNIYAIDPSSGAIAWQKNLGAPNEYGSYSTPVITAGTLITSVGFRFNPYSSQPVGTEFGGLVGLDPHSGDQRWEIQATSPFYNPPAIAGGMAITTADAAVVAIDPTSGATLWSTPIEAESRSAVAVANDEIIATDTDGVLYAFGLPTAANAALRSRTLATLHIVSRVPQFVNRIPVFCAKK